jgi:hypothetical protein
MSDDDAYAAGLAEIKALRERLRRLEEMALAEAKPPTLTDRTPNLGDALDTLRRTGSASGSAIDALRAAVEGPRTPATAPDRDALAEAARVATSDFRGSSTFAGAFAQMRKRADRLNTIEANDPGGSGRTDPSDPAATTAAERLDRVLKGQRR